MFGFMECIAVKFADWAFPLVMQSDTLIHVLEQSPDIDGETKEVFRSWAKASRKSFEEIEYQIRTQYGFPELEALRAEACSCIIHGHWQGAVCLTNILLEAFLKLALLYSNTDKPQEHERPLGRFMNCLAAPTEKYMQMKLHDTINVSCKQGLIDKETKKSLHEFRERFRNAFFHADIQKMFGDQTTPVTGLDFGNQQAEGPIEVPIHAAPFLLGEAMWQNAQANAIPYFKEVDTLIRKALPKVFPNLGQEEDEPTPGEGE